MVYGTLSMLVSMVNDITSVTHHDEDGLRLVVLLLDRCLIFCHAIALLALFGFKAEVADPLSNILMRGLAECLGGSEEGPISAFPRAESGYWG